MDRPNNQNRVCWEKNKKFFLPIFLIVLTILCIFCVLFRYFKKEKQSREDRNTNKEICRIVMEDNPAFTADKPVAEVKRGENLTFSLEAAVGYELTGCDYGNYDLEELPDETWLLTLYEVNYSAVVTLTAQQQTYTITYDANDGSGETRTVIRIRSHLRCNSLSAADAFQREGYSLIAWNTKSDGSGTSISPGSRMDYSEESTLYAIWEQWWPENCFTWKESGNGIILTGFSEEGEQKSKGTDQLVLPGKINGKPVWTISKDAFSVDADSRETGTGIRKIFLPEGLRSVKNGAFRGIDVTDLYLYDDIEEISDYALENCESFTTLHVIAVEKPVYSSTYYAAFADKMDYLQSIENQEKIVLFSGSSTRFGYNSNLFSEIFPDYEVANMGVFAYSNALPQLEMIRTFMKEKDILINSPEFDASQRQFCTTDALDDDFFCMMEADYDRISLLDMQEYSKIFTSFCSYLSARKGMETFSYQTTPAAFDEDGNTVETPSYNRRGDYCLIRPNSKSETPVYGLEVDYTVQAFPEDTFITPLNREYERFLQMDVQVFFAYAPRNRLAISEESTAEALQELDNYFKNKLVVPVLGTVEESLESGKWFYGTDNHLSTEGAVMRTKQIAAQLQAEGV